MGNVQERSQGRCPCTTGRISPNQRKDVITHSDVEATEFFKNFDNRLVNNPYKIAIGQGDHTVPLPIGQ